MKTKINIAGFTLIELLVVLGILAILFSIVLIAINPQEQIHQASDVTDKTVSDDVIKANVEYFTSANAMPWNKNSLCNDELLNGGTLATMPDCIHELTQGGQIQSAELASQQFKDIYMKKCGSTAVVCYNPKSKQENEDAGTKYDKFGNINPGCPVANGTSPNCYVCRPVMNTSDCDMNSTPTPTPVIPTNTPAPTITPTPTVTPTPTIMPTPTAKPTPTPTGPAPTPLYGIGGYKLDDTKLLRTYAVLSFSYPYFPPNYMVDISDRPDFGGTSQSGFGYFVNGSPVTANVDTIFNVWYAGDGNFGLSTSTSYLAQISLTPKHFTYVSMPYYWTQYVNGCGKTFYYRVVGWPGDSTGLIGPTYSAVVDCTTKVGVIDASQWWTYPTSDFNNDGVVNWTDYVIGALQTRFRAGGWQPPE